MMKLIMWMNLSQILLTMILGMIAKWAGLVSFTYSFVDVSSISHAELVCVTQVSVLLHKCDNLFIVGAFMSFRHISCFLYV